MQNNTVEVFLYLPSSANKKSVSDVADVTSHMAGVLKANVNQHVHRLIDVQYNPDHVSSQAILDAVRQEGNTATLVAM